MFKKEISFITDLNFNKLQVIGDRFTIDDLKTSRLHPAILHFINASIDRAIFSDRKRIEESSLFNYKSDRINNYFILISEEIKRAQHFDLNYLKQIVQNAIIFNVNFLTSPNNTLTKFIFGHNEVMSIEEIVLGISHAYYYRYLQKILLTYLDKKKVLSLTKEEFSQLLQRVDKISCETHLEDTLATAVNSMTNFFDQNSRTAEKLPIKAVQLYLEEKELNEFLSKLENKFISESSTLFLSHDILSVLRSVTPESELILDETIELEDELIEDNNEIESNQSDSELNKEDILELSENDPDIPNNEILSNDEFISEEQNLEILDDGLDDGKMKLDEDFEEIIEDNNDEDKEEDLKSNNEEGISKEPEKKKTDGIKILTDIINLTPLYESLLTEPKPFENFEKKLNLFESLKNKSENLNYQIDLTTIKDKLTPENIEIHKDKKIIINDDLETSNTLISNNEELKEHDTSENELLEIDNNIEKTTNVSSNFEEFLSAKETLDNIESDNDEDIISEKLGEEEHLTEDEISEVFSDLTFLDSDESMNDSNLSELSETNDDEVLNGAEETNNKDVNNNYNFDGNSNLSFTGLLLTKDMSKIIEFVFDYDMEEYYSIINNISLCGNDDEATDILETYCLNNNIDLDSKEVDTFRLIISEHFTKSYS